MIDRRMQKEALLNDSVRFAHKSIRGFIPVADVKNTPGYINSGIDFRATDSDTYDASDLQDKKLLKANVTVDVSIFGGAIGNPFGESTFVADIYMGTYEGKSVVWAAYTNDDWQLG